MYTNRIPKRDISEFTGQWLRMLILGQTDIRKHNFYYKQNSSDSANASSRRFSYREIIKAFLSVLSVNLWHTFVSMAI